MTAVLLAGRGIHAATSMSTDFTGSGQLLRLALRRDRVVLPLWSVYLGLFPAVTAASTKGIYDTQAQLDHFAETTTNSPAQIAMYGPVFSSELGSISTWKAGLYYTIIAVATILTIVRHTRMEEETGRAELVGATRVGRFAGLSAALALTTIGSLLAGIVCASSLFALDLPITGSVAFGAALAGSGMLWAGIGAIAAQVSTGARVARGLAFAVLGTAYVLRALGDAGSGTLSWFSPMGWCLQIRPFAQERWWVLIPLAAVAMIATAGAYGLLHGRDIGAGLIAERLGSPTAPTVLAGPFGLAWRLQRGTLAAWTVGLGGYGLLIGSAAHGVGDQLGDSQLIRDALTKMGGARSIEESFITYAFLMLAIAAAAYSISATLRLSDEENRLRLEALLAGAVGRNRFMASHIVLGLLGPALALSVAGAAAGMSYGAGVHDMGRAGGVLGAALIQLPAIWVLTGVTALLFGILPRFAAAAWGIYVAMVSVFMLGSFGGLPQWSLNLVPFVHSPKLPGGHFEAAPVFSLTAVAAALMCAGLITFRKRDLR